MSPALRAKVVADEPCPPIAKGPGRVVLTTVNHLNPYVFELRLADSNGHAETVRSTGYHKFYSADRRGWVSVEKLRIGEQIPGVVGVLTVADLHRLPGVHRVYNMTVEREHVYHVAALGALVHNDDCLRDEGFGTPWFGTQVHQDFPQHLMEKTGTNEDDWIFRTAPGQNGVDASWTGLGGGQNPGFEHAELKPATESGLNTIQRQMNNWQNDGQTHLYFYGKDGTIFDTGANFDKNGNISGAGTNNSTDGDGGGGDGDGEP